MGFGVSGASAIIFLGLLIAGVTMYSAADHTVERLSEASDDEGERVLDRRNTAINVTNATYVGATQNLTVAVENTGSTTLSVNGTTILVNNSHRPMENATVDGIAATDLWAPGEVLRLNTSEGATAPSRVTIVTENGVSQSVAVTEA